MIEAIDFRNAMSLLTSAVSVVTTIGSTGRYGFTASAVCSVTDSPPTLLVCMNIASSSHTHFVENKILTVNVLAAHHQHMSKVFSSKMSPEERFKYGSWTELETGAPVLKDALVSFDCQIEQIQEVGTHTIFICRVEFYSNRTFSREEFSNTKYAGSYSRPFRPDYTLEVYPSDYLKPEDAIREGAVSYIHFDAKYRITDLRSFIGPDENEMTEEQIKEEVENDKQDSVTNTYKRGDLLKMHTYNDAIRRTVGSYVLYPGDFDSKTKNYRLFEEILPGVGAFAIKPSIQTDSENALKDFIYEIIEARSRKYSRLNRMLSYSNLVLGEPAISTLDKRTTGKERDNKNIHNDLCVIGYLRPDYYELLSREGLLSEGRTFVFYYYAIKGESVYSHHEDIGKAKYIRFYQNDINATGRYEIEPFKGIIKSRELVSKKQLDDLLTESGSNDGKERSADFYYVLKVEIVSCTEPKISCNNSDLNGVRVEF